MKKMTQDQLDALKSHPGIQPHRPPSAGWCYESMLVQSDDGKTIQWYGQRDDGRWHPWGKPLPIPAGR
jgi:hypothetical protein